MPNHVTILSFILYAVGVGLAAATASPVYIAAILLPLSYILDCLDGQLARFTGRTSEVGDYLDKTLDVFKIFIINLGMGIAAFRFTDKNYFIILGFISCFGFLFRYYIKLETMFGAVNKDKDYLSKSRSRRHALYAELNEKKLQPKSFTEKLRWLWVRHHAVFALDEAEHVTFGAIAILFGRPDIWCWVFAVGQLTIACTRLFERGWQITKAPESLTYPLRK